MAVAQKRIWAFHDGPMAGYFVGQDPRPGTNVAEFVRADLSNALIAAAYEAAALRHEELWRENSAYKAHQIRALTPADARAALERVVKEAKGETT